jgi:monoterpene epsilon-lactone hydrolase
MMVRRNKPSFQSRMLRRVWSRLTGRVATFATPQQMHASMERSIGRAILPRGVSMQKVTAGGVPAEWLVPTTNAAEGVLLYVHGGAWTMGWYEPHRWLVSHLARATGRRALALDYRLAPEHPFPAPLHDCLAAYRWLLADAIRPEEIIIGGDSAGGNLTLTTMLALRDNAEPLPAAGVCLSPVTDLAGSGEPGPFVQDAGLPLDWARAQTRYYLGDTDPHLPLVSPFYADLHGLPPLLIQVGEDEHLLRDARRFVPRARAAGVDVTLQVWPGMWHVWQILVGFMPEADEAVAAIAAFCRLHQAH